MVPSAPIKLRASSLVCSCTTAAMASGPSKLETWYSGEMPSISLPGMASSETMADRNSVSASGRVLSRDTTARRHAVPDGSPVMDDDSPTLSCQSYDVPSSREGSIAAALVPTGEPPQAAEASDVSRTTMSTGRPAASACVCSSVNCTVTATEAAA